MVKVWHFWFATAVLILALGYPSAAQVAPKQAATPIHQSVAAKSVALPLFFEVNKGQTDPRVRFLTRSGGYTLFLTPTETVLAEANAPGNAPGNAAVRMQLVGANSAPVMTGFEELPGKVNYLIGNNPSLWHTGVSIYADVRSEQVYPGVDLLFHGDEKQLEYDFVVAPGADPSKIAFRVLGAARIEVNSQGNLVLHTANSQFLMYKPVIYQTVASERRPIEGSFVRKGKNEVAFKIGAYDRAQPLVIDPAIGYSTFLGGAGDDTPIDLQVDNSNPAAPKVYVAGVTTDTTTFPEPSNPIVGVAGGGEYGYIAKIDPTITTGGTGSLDYLTFVGGKTLFAGLTGTVCATEFDKLSLDLSQGTSGVEPVVGGITFCSDYPGTPVPPAGVASAGVLTRLTAAGNATDVSIFLAGNGNYSNVYPFVDSAGNVVVGGTTSSTNLPVTPNAYMPIINDDNSGYADCFAAKLQRSNYAPTYMTYINAGEGTVQGGGMFGGPGIACGAIEEASGKIGIGGSTISPFVFNVGSDGQDFANGFEVFYPQAATKAAFILVLDPTLSGTNEFVYGTYYGGGGITNPQTGAIDLGSGVVTVAGFTTSNASVGDIPLQNAFQTTNLAASSLNGETGFLAVLDTTQTGPASLLCSTYFGGSSGYDEINSLAYDASDPTAFRILLGGQTQSSLDFPTSNSLQAFQGSEAGIQDGFVAEFSVPLQGQAFSATLDFSTFIGGGGAERIAGVGVAANGTMYAAGGTDSADFFENTYPVTIVNGFQTTCTSCGAPEPLSDTAVFSLTPAAGATLESISVSPVTATIPANGTQQFQAEGFYSDGTAQNITTAAGTAWSSTQTSVATINAQGLVTAGATAGNTTIVATNGNSVGEASVAVTTAGEFSLSVVLNGSAYGAVTIGTFPISCSDFGTVAQMCTAEFAAGTVVTLFEQPNTGSVFGGWSGGGCSGTASSCAVTVNANTTVTATFNNGPGTNSITVTPSTPSGGFGTGTGTVTSSQYGINCTMANGVITTGSGPCTADFNDGSFVTLTATPAAGSVFSYWGGGICFGTSTCKLDAYTPQPVTATFTAVNYQLQVVGEGTGSGTISSVPAGLSCSLPGTCSANFPVGTLVTLTATPSPGSTFAGWANFGCTGTGTCTQIMNASVTVTATFNTVQFALTVTDAGTGSGSVLSNPAGIACYTGSTEACSVNFNTGQIVTLTATPSPPSTFAGFSSNCTSTGPMTCTIAMSAAESVTATFNTTVNPTLTVALNGTGNGSVTFTSSSTYTCSNTTGVVTGTCSASFQSGTIVNMSESPGTGSAFGGWSGGGCSGTGSTCNVTLTTNTTVTATFNTTATNDIRSALVPFTDDGTAPVTITWNPAFADTNYTAVCTAETTPSDFLLPVITGRTATTMTVIPTDGGSAPGVVDCIAIPDSDTSDIRHGRVAFSDEPQTVTVPWSPAFPDINYTVACTVETEEGIGGGFTSVISDLETGLVAVDNGQFDTGTMHCIAVPDSDTGTMRHGRVSLSGESATVPVPWNNPFPDANYAAACSDVQIEETSSDAAIAIDEGTKLVDSVTVLNEISFGTIHCLGAVAAPIQYTVTVSESGTGSGTVTSQTGLTPAIDCPSVCSASYPSGTQITLTPVASAGSTFAGWTGAKCEGTNPCTFTVDSSVTVQAVFNLESFTLTVSTAGTGAGSVTSQSGLNPPIDCTGGSSSGGCTGNYNSGTVVTLTAEPFDGSVFSGWSGACSGTSTCTITMNAAESVTATFNTAPLNFTLSVSVSGTGSGAVTGSSGGIDCTGGSSSGACTASYASGTVVTLTATPGSGSAFAGWGGACSGTVSTCSVTMNAAETVTATFNTSTFTFTTGPGYSTTVSTTPGGNIVVGFTLSSTTPTTVGLGCTSSAPQFLTCLITPTEVQLSGNGPSQVAIVLTSYCQGSAPGMPGGPTPGIPGGIVGVMLLGMALCGVALAYRGRRRMALSYALLLFAAVGGSACGNLPKGTAGATPPGNYTLTVTATVAGQAPQSIQIVVNVQ